MTDGIKMVNFLIFVLCFIQRELQNIPTNKEWQALYELGSLGKMS